MLLQDTALSINRTYNQIKQVGAPPHRPTPGNNLDYDRSQFPRIVITQALRTFPTIYLARRIVQSPGWMASKREAIFAMSSLLVQRSSVMRTRCVPPRRAEEEQRVQPVGQSPLLTFMCQ
ncbi:hypothetical protein KM043_017235 [Ampulex compressa]|nr:hypothetical protein KM043_017235 [Ampulex compressa]